MNEKTEGAEQVTPQPQSATAAQLNRCRSANLRQVRPQRYSNTPTAAPDLNIDTGAGLHLVHSLPPGHAAQQAYRLVVAKTLVADSDQGGLAHWPRH